MAGDLGDFVRSIYEPWERGDFGAADWADPEIEFVIADGPARGTWIGLEEMGRAWGEVLTAWEGFATAVEEIIEVDDERVLVLLHNRGAGRMSGVDVETIAAKSANLVEIRDGKVVKFVTYWDRQRAFDQLGLDPDAVARRGRG